MVTWGLPRSLMLGADVKTRRALFGRLWVCAIGLLAATGCFEPQPHQGGEAHSAPITGSTLASPVEARGELCADVGSVIVCWGEGLVGEGCEEGVCVSERTTPAGPPLGGWRCFGQGAERICESRHPASSPFRCSGETCIQDHPRFPDDGVWECGDRSGVSHCRRGYKPSGAVMGPPDPGWICNEDTDGHSICLDFSPDTPNGEVEGWECHFQHGDSVQRLCRRNSVLPTVGTRCKSGCPLGALCIEEICVPKKPSPDCWLNADCEGGSCLFGTCDSTVPAAKLAIPRPSEEVPSGHH